MARPETSEDALLAGRLVLTQPGSGYRVNVDSVLLAAFAVERGRPGFTLDLGAGVGALGLLVQTLRPGGKLALVEREAWLLELARRNLERAGVEGPLFTHDLERGLPPPLRDAADLVVCNPPYFEPERARARVVGASSRLGRVEPFVRAAARALRGTRGRAMFVYPANELPRLLELAATHKLTPKRLRVVHPDAASPARIALLELRRAKSGGLVIAPPLFEWEAPGRRSAELCSLLGER